MIALADSAETADAVASALRSAGAPTAWTYRMRTSEANR